MNHASEGHMALGRITGVFPTRNAAETVFDALRDRGYDKDDIDILMTKETRDRDYGQTDTEDRSELGDKAMEGAGVGSAIGGTIGAVVGAIAAIGTSLIVPGLGLVVAGPVAAALAGAGAGGLTGGLLGALIGSGIPEDEAKDYEEQLKQGGTAIAVTPRSSEDAHFIRDLFERHASEGSVFDSHLRANDVDYDSNHTMGAHPRSTGGSFRTRRMGDHGMQTGQHQQGSMGGQNEQNTDWGSTGAGTSSMGAGTMGGHGGSSSHIPGVTGETYQGSGQAGSGLTGGTPAGTDRDDRTMRVE